MKNKSVYFFYCLFIIFSTQNCSKGYGKKNSPQGLRIIYPFDGTVYPKNFRSPFFLWKTSEIIKSDWKIIIQTATEEFRFQSKSDKWNIPFDTWVRIRDNSITQKIVAEISGETQNGLLLKGKVAFSISPYAVEGNIFYRQVPVPHRFAISHSHLINYFLASLSNNNPPTNIIKPAEDKIYSCLTCHSISNDAKTLTMISKHPNDSLVTMNINSKINFVKQKDVLNFTNIQSLSVEDSISKGLEPSPGGYTDPRISPDGKHVLMVINAQYLNYFANHEIKVPFTINVTQSNLGVYSIKEKRISTLYGAHKPGYIHSTPIWSPDGKFITYALAKVPADGIEIKEHDPNCCTKLDPKKHYFMTEGMEFDLYTLAFNNGKGGEPKAVGATQNNGLFDYFPEYSPDGKWIVYTSSKLGTNIFLNQDSTLYIVSTKNDNVSRKLSSNFKGVMNSWHKFSLDGKWLLFKARPDGTNTELFLTHIDENGNDTPPILIDGLTKNRMYRANIPIFTNLSFDTVIKFPANGYCNAKQISYEEWMPTCVMCHSYNPYLTE